MSDPTETLQQSSRVSSVRRIVIRALVGLGATSVARPVSAHGGTAHAGTPHWIFLGISLVGVAIIALSIYFGRTSWADAPRRTIKSLLVGAVIAMIGTIAVTQIQIEPVGSTPTALE